MGTRVLYTSPCFIPSPQSIFNILTGGIDCSNRVVNYWILVRANKRPLLMSSNNVVLWQGFHGGQQTDLSQSPQGVSDN